MLLSAFPTEGVRIQDCVLISALSPRAPSTLRKAWRSLDREDTASCWKKAAVVLLVRFWVSSSSHLNSSIRRPPWPFWKDAGTLLLSN